MSIALPGPPRMKQNKSLIKPCRLCYFLSRPPPPTSSFQHPNNPYAFRDERPANAKLSHFTMPTPVSTFSPFTPFTPASSTHSSGGYFDRPAAGNMGISSSLARRPDMRNNGAGSSGFLRSSRLASVNDGLRQPSENGWRMASRMRDEAWSAWEQQLGNLSINTTTSIDLTPKPLRLSNKVNSPRNSTEGIESDKRTASEDKKTSSMNTARSASNLNISELHPEPCRSISSHGLPVSALTDDIKLPQQYINKHPLCLAPEQRKRGEKWQFNSSLHSLHRISFQQFFESPFRKHI
ncbi:hypothetical protein PCANC_22152 [Puccinia coronata f. sp. avenae]|uniref:Uncharacterized protein n=1 Tax=Puccinia coronata f. sp. avenae TaxID=200324 RepID=A0A2N5TXI7_9BASI|nr:hypothetical protein PCANC_22152 [Puccinia coronata f. sp. avenae]PLW34563.1 hypothetical protein PCASD_12924 [Puccinia coronata f. sp. avenae]